MYFICVLVFAVFAKSFATIPKANCDFKNEATIEGCYKSFIANTFPELASTGIPELNILPLDPFHIPSMVITSDAKLIMGSIEITNTDVKGLKLTDVKVLNIESDNPSEPSIELEVFEPELKITGHYKADVQVLQLNVSGEGEYDLTLTGVLTSVKAQATLYKKGKADHLKINSVTVTPEFKDFQLSVTEVNNNPIVVTTVELINKLWQVFYKDIYVFIAPHIENIVQERANLYFDNVPLISEQ